MGAESSTLAAEGSVPGQTEQGQAQQEGPKVPKALVLVGPSGVGKGTLIQELIKGQESLFGFSCSHTTRQPRAGEEHGKHYFFCTRESFAKDVAEDRFLEWAEVHGNLYGTSIAAVRSVLESGRVCLLDIDVQGARSVRNTPLEALFVFVAPPSLEDLARRLVGRGTETHEQVLQRLTNAKSEINSLNERGLYDYLIINDSLADAAAKLRHIATRAAAGLAAEPGQVPESVIIEDAPLPDLGLDQLALKANTPAIAAETTDPTPALTVDRGISERGTDPASPPAIALHAASTSAPVAVEPEGVVTPTAAVISKPLAPVPQPGGGVPEMPGMAKWAKCVALVTGASSGIGWACCEALALQGLRVVAVARRKERLEELQTHMAGLGVPSSHFLPVVCDITKEAEVATLPRIVSKRWPEAGGVDVLVNNAGMSRNDASLIDGNMASWVQMLSTNVLGTAMTTRAVLQDMKRRQRFGHIINMVGLSGHRIPDGPQGGGFYCATKSAVRTLTEGLRQEARALKLPLRVTAISPGIVETEFFNVKTYGDAEAAKLAVSAFPCLQPVDIANAILWALAAPEHMEVNDIIVRPTEQTI